MASDRSLLVAAIDFGTTYSGWAFSFTHDYRVHPTNISVKHWQSGGQLATEKAPTCALIKPDGKTLEAFGYDAENRYLELIDNKEHAGYHYFRRFKMSLNKKLDEGIRRDFTVEDEMGQSLPALTVFSLVIEYLVKDVMQHVNRGMVGDVLMTDVSWVLTVPAIWTDAAKDFMRRAAEKAGIERNRLTICLEPEAASLYCRQLPVEKHQEGTASFPPGTKYMILDVGGGTVDTTVHQVHTSGNLKEIHAASGGGWGGTLVDQAYQNFLIDLVTPKVYREFMKTETDDWLELWRDFEMKKKAVSPDDNSKVMQLRIPASLVQIFEKTSQSKLHEVIGSSRYKEQVELKSDKLRVQSGLMRSFFAEPISKIVAHLKNMLRHSKVRDIKAVLMAGGFSESSMLQQALKSAFPEVTMIEPNEASTVILKGAVLFGHDPNVIKERVLKYTYGVHASVQFINGKHPPSKRRVYDIGIRCMDIFSKHAEINQTVRTDESCEERRYTPVNRSQTMMAFPVYASTLKNPQFVDKGCSKIGELKLDIPQHKGDMKNGVFVSMKFGGTEIKVTGRDEETGEETKVAIDFLDQCFDKIKKDMEVLDMQATDDAKTTDRPTDRTTDDVKTTRSLSDQGTSDAKTKGTLRGQRRSDAKTRDLLYNRNTDRVKTINLHFNQLNNIVKKSDLSTRQTKSSSKTMNVPVDQTETDLQTVDLGSDEANEEIHTKHAPPNTTNTLKSWFSSAHSRMLQTGLFKKS